VIILNLWECGIFDIGFPSDFQSAMSSCNQLQLSRDTDNNKLVLYYECHVTDHIQPSVK